MIGVFIQMSSRSPLYTPLERTTLNVWPAKLQFNIPRVVGEQQHPPFTKTSLATENRVPWCADCCFFICHRGTACQILEVQFSTLGPSIVPVIDTDPYADRGTSNRETHFMDPNLGQIGEAKRGMPRFENDFRHFCGKMGRS